MQHFIKEQGEGVDRLLTQFTDGIKLEGLVNIPGDKKRLQPELDSLEENLFYCIFIY